MLTVLTAGTFDLAHPGHFHLFEQCARLAGVGGRVVVSLNPDEFVEQYKGVRPVQSLEERMAVVASCKWVHRLTVTPGADMRPLIRDVNPHILAVGDDWASKDYYGQTMTTPEWLEDQDVTLVYVPRLGNLSTTELKARIMGQPVR